MLLQPCVKGLFKSLQFLFPPTPSSGQCHCMFAVELRLLHGYVTQRNLDEAGLRRHSKGNNNKKKRETCDVGQAMQPCTRNHPPTSLQQRWKQSTQQMHTDWQRRHTVHISTPKPNQEFIKKKKREYLVLPSGVRVLHKENQTGAEREVRTTHQYYTCIVTMHALHDSKPWPSH